VVRARFLELAGGKKARLVIIPTANGKADHLELLPSYAWWRSQPAASVKFLHTRERAKADDPTFAKPLTDATGVWFSGGDQSRLLEAYQGTLVEREVRKVLSRGGVIGGTSAGAAIMSAVMILGGDPMARVGQGFGFLPGFVVDQHFENRHRQERLLNVLARYPQYLGLGIDEQTAVVVTGRHLTVLGNDHVCLYLSATGGQKANMQHLNPGQEVDLASLSRTTFARVQQSATRDTKRLAAEVPMPLH
jgi:cyanophycinase